MAQAALRLIFLGLAASGLLMGCVQGSQTAPQGSSAAASLAPAAATGDIEAPEVFQTTDTALWDGRPSLGGIWVASPDVQDPERVVMVNPTNGKTVQGALFRRERDNPGPRLQMSSDAAEALGMLAGQPVEIKVTALRRAEPAPEPEPAPAAEGAATAEVPVPDGTAATADAPVDEAAATAAAATAALAATGAAVADPATPAADGAVEAASTDPAGVAAEGAAADAAVTEPPKRKTWKERRAEAKAAREAKKAAAAAAAAAPDLAEVPATAAGAAVDAVAVTSLDGAPVASEGAVAAAASAPDAAVAEAVSSAEPAAEAAVEPVVEPPKTRRQRRAEEAAAKAAAEAEAEAAAAAAAAAAVAVPSAEAAPSDPAAERPIQVAAFTKEPNATRAVEALAKIGIVAEARKTEANGKMVWGVVTTGDEAKLKAIKGFGFADAFFLQ